MAGASDFLGALEPQPSIRLPYDSINRKDRVMTWRLPNGNSVQMYINPQQLTVDEKKIINATRTKGGFVIQYWGDDLTSITITGHTGSSGVEGINILRNIYHIENRAFDEIAKNQQALINDGLSSATSAIKVANDIRSNTFILQPNLGALAASVLMFYQGVEYRGFFTGFTCGEKADAPGIFDYTIKFTAIETRGIRQNVFPWQKQPVASDAASMLVGAAANALRSLLGANQQGPEHFTPFNAPYTFGGSGLLSTILGIGGAEQQQVIGLGNIDTEDETENQ